MGISKRFTVKEQVLGIGNKGQRSVGNDKPYKTQESNVTDKI